MYIYIYLHTFISYILYSQCQKISGDASGRQLGLFNHVTMS